MASKQTTNKITSAAETGIEKELRFFQTIADGMHNWILLFDSKGELLYSNPSVITISDYSAKDLQEGYVTWRQIAHDEDTHKVEEAIELSCRQLPVDSMEFRIVRADKTIRFVNLRSRPIVYDDNFIGFYVSIKDISKAKLCKYFVDTNNGNSNLCYAKFEALTNNSFDIMSLWSKDGTIVYESHATRRILGYEAGKRIGKNLLSYVHPDDLKQVSENFKSLAAQPGAKIKFEYRIRHDNNTWVWLETYGQNFLKDPYINGMIANSCNITERKLVENGFHKAQQKLQALYTNLPFPIIVHDAETGEIIDCNEFAYKSLGFESALEMRTQGFWTESPYSFKEAKQKIQKTVQEGSQQFEWCKLKKNGEQIWEYVKLITIDSGGLTRVLAASVDITERKKAEIQLQKYAQEVAQHNASKDRFISILSHDLKQPFNTILGFSDILLYKYDSIEKQKAKKLLEIINRTTHQTFQLLNELLLWAKSQSGKIELNPETFLFSGVCENLIREKSSVIKHKNLQVNCFSAEKILVYADLNMFKTILRNLLSNAIKFSHKGGEINLFAEIHSGSVKVTVSDSGIGIKKEIIPKLWDITQKTSSVGTDNETGTGFGLSLCKELVEKHGGKIWAESTQGEGSEFIFTIPLSQKEL